RRSKRCTRLGSATGTSASATCTSTPTTPTWRLSTTTTSGSMAARSSSGAPSSLTDLHSLAVFLFYLFMHGHPLEGVRTDSSYSWASDDHHSETDLALRHFGTEPVFIFDPDDHSNPPRP